MLLALSRQKFKDKREVSLNVVSCESNFSGSIRVFVAKEFLADYADLHADKRGIIKKLKSISKLRISAGDFA